MSVATSRGVVRPPGRAVDTLLLLALLLVLWQAVGSWARGMAISGPLATFA